MTQTLMSMIHSIREWPKYSCHIMVHSIQEWPKYSYHIMVHSIREWPKYSCHIMVHSLWEWPKYFCHIMVHSLWEWPKHSCYIMVQSIWQWPKHSHWSQTHVTLPQQPHTKNDPNTSATDTHHVATTASRWERPNRATDKHHVATTASHSEWPKHSHHRHTSCCHNSLTLRTTQTLVPRTHIKLPQWPHADNDPNTSATDTHHVASTASCWQWP